MRSFALFFSLLCSFANLRLHSFALICVLLRAFACFCIRLRLERPGLGTSDSLSLSLSFYLSLLSLCFFCFCQLSVLSSFVSFFLSILLFFALLAVSLLFLLLSFFCSLSLSCFIPCSYAHTLSSESVFLLCLVLVCIHNLQFKTYEHFSSMWYGLPGSQTVEGRVSHASWSSMAPDVWANSYLMWQASYTLRDVPRLWPMHS